MRYQLRMDVIFLSLNNMARIHLTVRITVLFNLFCCVALVAHVSLPSIMLLLTSAAYTFPFRFIDTPFLSARHSVDEISSMHISHISQFAKFLNTLKPKSNSTFPPLASSFKHIRHSHVALLIDQVTPLHFVCTYSAFLLLMVSIALWTFSSVISSAGPSTASLFIIPSDAFPYYVVGLNSVTKSQYLFRASCVAISCAAYTQGQLSLSSFRGR